MVWIIFCQNAFYVRKCRKGGIADGFVLIGQFICSGCEQKITNLNYDDPIYTMMVQTLKEIIYGPRKKFHEKSYDERLIPIRENHRRWRCILPVVFYP